MAKKKILIVDDEEDFAKLVKLNLERTGNYEVRVEFQGIKAIVAAREFRPNLILLDILMPGMDGGEVAETIRDDKDLKNIPIVFLTAATTKKEVSSHGGIIGGRPFIAKPVSVEELISCIEKNIKIK